MGYKLTNGPWVTNHDIHVSYSYHVALIVCKITCLVKWLPWQCDDYNIVWIIVYTCNYLVSLHSVDMLLSQ